MQQGRITPNGPKGTEQFEVSSRRLHLRAGHSQDCLVRGEVVALYLTFRYPDRKSPLRSWVLLGGWGVPSLSESWAVSGN